MLKHLAICAALVAFGTGSAQAQQQAMLQKIAVPGAHFDILLAMPKSPSAVFDLSESPDALIIHLVGGKLALGFDSEEKMLKALDTLRHSISAYHAEGTDGEARTPIALYIVPKGE